MAGNIFKFVIHLKKFYSILCEGTM